jgi:PKD repeat protein
MRRILPALAAAAALTVTAFPSTAGAAPPSNDAFANANVIDPSALPFGDSVAIDEATTESGESLGSCTFGSGNAQTVWYSITPTSSGVLRVSDSASFYYQFIAVYPQNGSGLSGLGPDIGCASWAFGSNSTTVNVTAGQTYYIQAGSNFASSGTISVSVQLILPPANDDFARATPITAVPFSDQVDTTAASVEPNEPTPSCGYGQSAGTVWYAFTPSTTGSYSASSPWGSFTTQVAAYTGTELGNLASLGCQTSGQLLTFQANAGQTYYLQLGGIFGSRGTVNLSLDVAPNPVANFFYYPSDPSIFDTIQFIDQSYDPGQVGIQSRSWDFGDGSASIAASPTHTYATDRDYTVKLTVTTADGRTATSTQVVHVRTHDVTISKLTVPQSASSGQTRQITVGVTDSRYPEMVSVQLLASVPGGGFQQVGVLQQQVSARGNTRPTTFSFSYTFTKADASVGKVTFQAIATIVGARDAQPSDNTVTALPTKVNG